MAAASAHLTQFLQQLVDANASLQHHILERVAARVARHESTTAVSRSVDPIAPLDSVPLWSRPEGFPPLPHTEPPKSTLGYEPPLRWAPLEMVLMLDMFEVAQRSPSGCQALFLTSTGCVEASASAAVAAWLSFYVTGFIEERRTKGAVASSGADEQRRPLPWPWPWCAAILHRQLKFRVRVLFLRIPSLYAAVTSGRELALGERFGNAHSASPATAAPSAPHLGEGDSLTEQLSSILPLSSELEQMPSARLTNTHSTCCVYPCDRFLESSHTVQVVGVVHQVFYEGHSVALPAPWVTMLLLPPPTESLPRPELAKRGKESPRRCEVDLSLLTLSQRSAIAVIGGVVAVRGHTQVARRLAGTKAEAAAPRLLRGVAETPLEEYIAATWATPVQLSTGLLRAPSCAWPSRSGAYLTLKEAAGTSPVAAMAALNHVTVESTVASPGYSSSAGVRADGGCSGHCCDEALQLAAAEEEAATRASLACWEGARLALAVEAPGQAHNMARAAWLAHSFSASLDFIVSTQLALASAQMADGVVVLAVDEVVPESLLTRMLRRLDGVVPCATFEVPSSILARAKPSFFLPSYRTQRTVAAPPPAANAPGSAAHAVVGAPAAHRARHSRLFAGSAVAAPPPPCYPEVLRGGALTHANGRTLVLQRIEALPTPTLKLLQEALRDEAGDAETMEAAVFDSQDSERAFGSCVAKPPCTSEQQRGQQQQTTSTNSCGTMRRLIRREGGQTVKYCATRSALCSVRQGASLTQKSKLFEFAERCDIVVRPAYDTLRQAAALQGGTVPAFCKLLHSRGEAWLGILGAALTPLVHYAVPDSASLSPTATTSLSGAPSDTPTLSEACSRLLSTYFIAAKALCVEGADAGMMKTLVKLTVAHTKWRTRLTMALQQRSGQSIVASSPTCAVTALIDAVAAVGLCDATMHFFTAKTLLGECVFRLLESEAWPIVAAEHCSAHLPQYPEHEDQSMQDGASFGDEAVGLLDWQQLYAEIEYRTRLVPAALQTATPQSSTFSILRLAKDLQDRLERAIQQRCLTPTMLEGGA
ncbi:hypothetical protein LSCM4_02353 [Leishmania orientalis]|uniref:Uncharacterized protein n=1 Tax=Leishmania orientalis TaxID=2249476 RepID=A0A836GNS2_9TRYP|nr:hypothetical protein LSCM4_02353 [Leishmania orientalis]